MMREHLRAIAAVLDGDAVNDGKTFILSAPVNTLPPYRILEPVGLPDDLVDRCLDPADPALAFEVRVKSVGGVGDGALIMADNARATLSPNGAPTAVPLAGRHVEVAHVRLEQIYEDDSLTIAGTNRHPAVVVETYSLDSQPTA